MYEYLDRRYALALYKIAEGKGKIEEYMEQLQDVADVISNNIQFLEFIEHPEISTSIKKKTFVNVFKGKIEEDILSFLLLLIDKGRISQLYNKIKEMGKIYLENHNTVIATVKTVIPLEDDEKEDLTEKLTKKFNKEVLIKEEIDPNIIGGVYVEINNVVIDGTVKSKLSEMRKIMLKGEQR